MVLLVEKDGDALPPHSPSIAIPVASLLNAKQVSSPK